MKFIQKLFKKIEDVLYEKYPHLTKHMKKK